MWQCYHLFLKPVLEVMYIVNSCLANPDNISVSHSTICNTNLLWASWGVVMLDSLWNYLPATLTEQETTLLDGGWIERDHLLAHIDSFWASSFHGVISCFNIKCTVCGRWYQFVSVVTWMQCTVTLWKGQTRSSQSGTEPLTSFHIVAWPSLTFIE